MIQLSEELILFLATHPEFTTVMGAKIFPIVAPEGTNFPFATYRINEQTQLSYDGTAATIELFFWFGPEKYKKAAEFTDAMKPIIELKPNYEWQNATVDFIESGFSYVGIINISAN
jgi:hypothetical protein